MISTFDLAETVLTRELNTEMGLRFVHSRDFLCIFRKVT